MMVRRLLAIGGIVVAAALGAAGTAIATPVAHDAPSAAEARLPLPSCTSGGMVDKKVEGSPVGVYGGAWIRCNQAYPSPANSVTAEVTLRRDGVAVASDKGVCNLPTSGGGCSAGTPVVANPAGAQNWCAHVKTATAWNYSWSDVYCASY